MAIQIKPIAAIADKFVKRAGAAGADYASGVQNPRTDQATAAAAAAPVWAQAVSDAAARDAFAKGVRAAGSAKWMDKAKSIGAQRYPQGVQAAKADFEAGFAPYAQVLAGLTLQPRGIKGTNVGRVQQVVDALRKAKTGAA